MTFRRTVTTDNLARTGDLAGSVLASASTRMLVNAHRQSGKTDAAIRLAASIAVNQPGSLVVLVVPKYAMIGHLFRQAGCMFPGRTGNSAMYPNGSQVTCLPGYAAALAGLPDPDAIPDAIIVDEAALVFDDIHDMLDSMLPGDGAGGRLVKLSTPSRARGRFHADWVGDGPWERIELKASANPRVDREWLAGQRAILSARQYAQDFECEFVPPASVAVPA